MAQQIITNHGLYPGMDVGALASLLHLCTLHRAFPQAELLHAHLIRSGFAHNVFLNNLLVRMYATCGSLPHAQAVFHNMPDRNSHSWSIMLAACAHNGSLDDARIVFSKIPQRNVVACNTMIKAYAQNGHGNEALQLFGHMQTMGFQPTKITFICAMDACASMAALEEGRRIHASLVANTWDSDVIVGTALINMYGKSGSLDDARTVFQGMPLQNVVSWSAMISVCAQNDNGEESLQLFDQMRAKGFEPNEVTFICVLDACASVPDLEGGREVHSSLVSNGWELDIVVGTALINMYGKCGSFQDARAMFVEMSHRNVVSWSVMIAACAQNGHSKEALQFFSQMQSEGMQPEKVTLIHVMDACADVAALELGQEIHANVVSHGWDFDVVVGNALINIYGNCESLNDAKAVFAGMPQRNVVSWNAMIAMCTRNGHGKEALQVFNQMKTEDCKPNEITFICVMDACASVAALEEGHKAHASVIDNGWEFNVVLGTALINMYGRCGSLNDAKAVFVEMPQRNVVSWSAMIAACAQNGHSKDCLQLFGQMQAEHIEPNEITFVCILTACSHMGLVADARQYFISMSQNYGISPSRDHYMCMIDLLGRAGLLGKAEQLIHSMPFEPITSAWLSLLSSCRIHSDVELALRAANHAFDLDEKNASPYVLLANIHAAAGTQDDIEQV